MKTFNAIKAERSISAITGLLMYRDCYKRQLLFSLVLALALLQGGCSFLHTSPHFSLRSPQSLQQTLTAYQSIEIHYQEETFNLQAAVNVSKENINIIFMTPLGQRIGNLSYNGHTLEEEKMHWIKAKFPLQYILEAVQMIFWPVQSLQQSDWRFEQGKNTRTVWHRGQQVALIEYDGMPPWTGKVKYVSTTYTLFFNSQLLSLNNADRKLNISSKNQIVLSEH